MKSMLRTALALAACTFFSTPGHTEIDAKKWLSQPKAYVGSEVCRGCHLEHYDAWKRTLHSRMLQDAKANEDVLVTSIAEDQIRADLALKGDKLKVPAEEIFVIKQSDVLYTIGSQWKQRYLFRHEGTLKIAPTQFNIDSGRWVNYHEHDWAKRPWLKKCGGCHATGVDLEKDTFLEPGVGCEACHGPGSHHAAQPTSALFEKRSTIINPGKLTGGVAVQICGSCHNRGKSTKVKGSSWPVGYRPGKALGLYYKSISAGSKKLYSNEYSKGHHQQYLDWKLSKHADSGITCMTCHSVHELGNPLFRSKTKAQGDKLCLSCHEQTNDKGAHSVHSFGNCVSCHMPRIAKSAESGDIRSHVFDAITPKEAQEFGTPSSCQMCHQHKDEDPVKLQERWEALTSREVMAATVPHDEAR